MKLTRLVIGMLIAGLPLAYADILAGPHPDINISVNTWDGVTVGGGGQFGGFVANVPTEFWCVDFQEAFAFGSLGTGAADLIPFSSGLTSNAWKSDVRFSNVTNGGTPGWLNTTTQGTSLGTALPSDAQARYEMAAYLINQYDFVAGTADHNNSLQEAIWAITDNSGYSGGGIYETGNHNLNPGAPGNQITLTADVNSWIQTALDNYTRVDPAGWAVVSWGANADGSLNTGPYYSDSPARQTFVIRMGGAPLLNGQTPEPGFYGLLALGLGGLFVVIDRRKKKTQV